ncbi:hypothetical protein EX30DRAFT_63301 [Ascodesmis nigricans]|uniref:Uncharacterized protein n=1 Tax=Ascodesmis nigricans TaxID=341454 RepID=A0A4S2MUN5_9PEZI|nr:hypothetical protein EX30DRAFT_63301 [Ascodesmis nigricans]
MSMTQMYKQAHLAATVAAAAATPPHHHTPQQTPVPSRSPMPIYPQHQRPQPAAYTVPHQHPQAAVLQMQQQQQAAYIQQQARQQYHPPAPPTTFTLPESVTHNIPEEVASKFLRDVNGQLLWFTVPPIANERYESGAVGHSVQYLAKKKELEERRKRRREEVEKEQREAKRRRQEEAVKEKQEAERIMVKALGVWTEQLAGSR